MGQYMVDPRIMHLIGYGFIGLAVAITIWMLVVFVKILRRPMD